MLGGEIRGLLRIGAGVLEGAEEQQQIKCALDTAYWSDRSTLVTITTSYCFANILEFSKRSTPAVGCQQ